MYDQCSVIHAKSLSLKATRALLIKAFGVQLKSGLSLLGIKVLERM
jgi:arginyl-tRNA synthetase